MSHGFINVPVRPDEYPDQGVDPLVWDGRKTGVCRNRSQKGGEFQHQFPVVHEVANDA